MSLWKMCWRDIVYISQWSPLNHHNQYTIDLILLVSPTLSKDGVTTGRLKRDIFVLAPCCFFTFILLCLMCSHPLLWGRHRQRRPDSFSVLKYNDILHGKSLLLNVPIVCTDTNSIRASPKGWFCQLY